MKRRDFITGVLGIAGVAVLPKIEIVEVVEQSTDDVHTVIGYTGTLVAENNVCTDMTLNDLFKETYADKMENMIPRGVNLIAKRKF